jgi:hypothetical protein
MEGLARVLLFYTLFLGPEMEPVVGFEPTTRSLQNCCSTTELNWLKDLFQAT